MNRRHFIQISGGAGAAAMVELIGIPGYASESPEKLVTTVQQYNGAPRLFINGKPDAGIAMSHNGFYRPDRYENAYEVFEKFAQKDIHQFRALGLIEPREDGTLDTKPFDEQMERLLSIDSQLMLMLRIIRFPPDWYLKKYPEEMMVHLDSRTGIPINENPLSRRPSFSSKKFRKDNLEWIDKIVRYAETKYSRNIMAYFYHGGVIEWAYQWAEVLSDYSRPQQKGFQEWLKEKYKTNQALREAWNDNEVSFDTVEIPRNRTRTYNQPALFHPQKDRNVIDYLYFHSEIVADACVEAGGQFKNTLKDLGQEKIVGTWYGFDFWPATHPAHVHNSGHHAMHKVLESPHIDFLGLIHSHHERTPGGMWLQHYAAGSVALHGKLSWEEEDTATYMLDEELGWQEKIPTLRQSIGVLARNFAGTLSVAGAEYWHDFSGERWFGSDELVEEIAKYAKIAEEDLKKPFRSGSQIIVFSSKESFPYIRQDRPLTDSLLSRQISELSHIGAPIDVYYLEDIPKLADEGKLGQYRMAVFMNALKLSDEVKQAIQNNLAKNDRTLLWLYGTDCVTPEGYSAEQMGEMIQMPVEILEKQQPLKAVSHLTGTLIQYGEDEPLCPVFTGKTNTEGKIEHDNVEVLGWYLQPTHPAFLRRKLSSWTSVWSGAPALPALVLQKLAREAGVHIYAETGDQVFAWNDMFALHAAFKGKRTVTFSKEVDVKDVIADKIIAGRTKVLSKNMERGDTYIIQLI